MLEYSNATVEIGANKGNVEMRHCTICDFQNPVETELCLNCGAALSSTCPVCGHAVPATNNFCNQCGAALSAHQPKPAAVSRAREVRQNLRALMPTTLAQKISATAGDILGEQREVTVLYINVMHSTDRLHPLDNEDSYLLLDEALRFLVEVAYKYEGTIDKFTGDGLIVLFGAPLAHENDPERAVRAALEMQTIFQTWRTEVKQARGFDFQMRVGINTGTVIAGKIGNDLHMEYTVIGETVNLAYHLQLTAQPDTLIVSPETYQRTRSLFEYKMLPALTIKWLPQPTQTFQLLSPRKKSETAADRPYLQTPMIGRSHTLGQLQHTLAKMREEKLTHVTLISGEAGIGKSRLVTEFRQMVEMEQVGIYQGNCLTYARQAPLWVIAEILRDIIGLSESDPPETKRDTLTAFLSQHNLAQPEILPYLVYVLGLPQKEAELEERLRQLEPTVLQRQTHAALRQLFLTEARVRPTILIFEDLHWIDLASRDFLEYLIQTTDEVWLLLILVARNIEGEPTLEPLVATARLLPARLTELKLQALSTAEGQLLIDQLIPQVTTDAWRLKQRVIARTEGNPFYIEEIIRMLIDRGGLVRDPANGTWQVTPQANDLLETVPDSVKGLILARFDRLPEGLRRILQKVSILGDAFPTNLLQSLFNTPLETMALQLGQLENRQFLAAAPFRSEPGYTFKHALLRETIYDTLLKRDRARIHTQIARAIKDSLLWLPEEQAEMLAYHYTQGSDPIQAVPYLLTAAKNAAQRCAFDTSIVHYRQAISILPEQSGDQEKAFFEARFGLGRVLKFVGQFDEATGCYTQGLLSLWRSDLATNPTLLKPILIDSLRQLADIRQREGDYDRAMGYLEIAFQLLGENSPKEQPELWQSVIDRMSWVMFRRGSLAEARKLALEAVAKLGDTNQTDPLTAASLYNTLGGIAWLQGQFDEAVTYVKQSLEFYESVGYLWGSATAYGNLGVLYNSMGKWLRASEYHERAQAVQQIIGNPQGQAVCFDNLGILNMYLGKHEEALQDLNQGLSIRTRLGDNWGIAQSRVNLAHLALVQSDFEQAATHAKTALSLSESLGSAEIQTHARWIVALVQADTGQLQDALLTAGEALEMAQSAAFLEKEIECLRVLGVIQARSQRFDEAETTLRRSVELAIAQNHPYLQGQALYELGRLYLSWSQMDHSGADEWRSKALATLSEAVSLFESLGAAHDLKLATEVMSQIELRDVD